MSLTSYRAAPPRAKRLIKSCFAGRNARSSRCIWPDDVYLAFGIFVLIERFCCLIYIFIEEGVSGRPGGDLLSRALRQSTISAARFHGRVRNGVGWDICAITTWSSGTHIFQSDIFNIVRIRHPYMLVIQRESGLVSGVIQMMGITPVSNQADRGISIR